MVPDIRSKPLIFLFINIIFLSLGACQSKQIVKSEKKISTSLVNWLEAEKLSNVVDQAIKEDKLVFLNMVTDWCLPCKMMDQDVFSDKSIADFLNQNFINYKVDAEKSNGPDLKYLYKVNTIPTLIFLDHKGRVLQKHEGAAYHTKLHSLATEALQLKS